MTDPKSKNCNSGLHMSKEEKNTTGNTAPSGVGGMEYDFRQIEERWQKEWKEKKRYAVSNDSSKPKYYVLDMFPYPSGAGLHVGHPLGYIASDIYSRYKRLKGFNVLHPMGFDSFGLPAEQYALETGQHPAETTRKNIATFKSQLDKIGFCYDWDREVQTSDPNYYKWTQWLFLQLFNSYFCNTQKKARPISELVKKYETKGSRHFTAEQWKAFSKKKQEDILMQRRLAFSAYGEVNWCEALGTVLANDEVVNGVSERGGFPVEKRRMRQWFLRITAYADRLLEGLETVDFSDSMKEMQRNWIGKSEGAEIEFNLTPNPSPREEGSDALKLKVYTTRPDTIFGVDFMVIAPEHELIGKITTPEQQTAVNDYLKYVKSRSERERLAEAKTVTGCFTGAYAINPFDGRKIPVWTAEYVLAGYGTGAIMAVPCGDQRDFLFATHFNIPITNIIGAHFNGQEANPTKEAILENSGFLNGLLMKDAIGVAVNKIEELGIGKRKVNYKMRDAGFSRQRYWGEPFPIVWKDDIAIPLEEKDLPLELPHVDKYGPGPNGEGPLANLSDWLTELPPTLVGGRRETSTMPGYAGSSWYFLRYMDPHNNQTFCDRKASDYWNQVDLYIGGTEHAVGHLLYSRMWTKVMYDLGLIGYDEPYKRLVNQGMITGRSYFLDVTFYVTGVKTKDMEATSVISSYNSGYPMPDKIIAKGKEWIKGEKRIEPFRLKYAHSFVDGKDRMTESAFKKYFEVYPEKEIRFTSECIVWEENLTEDGERFLQCKMENEKMSKSKFNVDNPDDLCNKYGADTFRMYEMFLGPVEASKPWDTKGIEGVHRFLRKLWRLFNDEVKGKIWTTEKATDAELKVLHRTIKKIEEDTERFSFNTAVSTFMICVNELADLKCNKKEILEPLLILLTPYAPHIAEELWHQLGNEGSILDASYPAFNPALLVESSKEYPVSVNGKLRTSITLPIDLEQKQVEEEVLKNDVVQKWLDGKPPKKIIYVKNKMINVVL